MGGGELEYPPLVYYGTEAEYRLHYERIYCKETITTFDGINVRFRKERFDHCFYESKGRNRVKDLFSEKRAQRIDWIKTALKDSDAELYIGWDRKRKRHDPGHRVALVVKDYVVVIRIGNNKKAQFVTAYVADSASTLAKIKGSPKWVPLKKQNR